METDFDYSEKVTLLAQREEPRMMSLADAVRTVVAMEPALRRFTGIVRDGAPVLKAEEIEAIHDRPDFPEDRNPKLCN